MPSVILGNTSGGQQLISGNVWSGLRQPPVGTLYLKLDPASSGNAYVSLSGNMTTTSGGYFLSGGGMLDGMIMKPGDVYPIPKLVLTGSSGLGVPVWIQCDAAASGRSRMYWEMF